MLPILPESLSSLLSTLDLILVFYFVFLAEGAGLLVPLVDALSVVDALSGLLSPPVVLLFLSLLGDAIGLVFSVGSWTGFVSSSVPSSISAVKFF